MPKEETPMLDAFILFIMFLAGAVLCVPVAVLIAAAFLIAALVILGFLVLGLLFRAWKVIVALLVVAAIVWCMCGCAAKKRPTAVLVIPPECVTSYEQVGDCVIGDKSISCQMKIKYSCTKVVQK